MKNTRACVSNITVMDSFIKHSDNGVRIKTWQGGLGSVSQVKFINIHMDTVRNPIMIDQYYCQTKGLCPNQTSAVRIHDITYQRITGTYDYRTPPMHLGCSDSVPCTNLTFSDVELMPSQGQNMLSPFCWNAYGDLQTLTIPPVFCLLGESGGIDLKLAVVMGPMALYGNGTSQRQQQQETPSGNLNLSSDLLSGFGAESGEAYLNCRSGSRTLKLSMLQVRFKQEEVKIQAWDSDEKRKSEPEMKRMEEKGGLSVSSLYALNRGLMLKWVWRFYLHKTSLWASVIKAIYGDDGKVGKVTNDGIRSCWMNIVNEISVLKNQGVNVFDFMRLKLGNGDTKAFWEDNWIGGNILKDLYPRIYALETCKSVIVIKKFTDSSLDTSFRRKTRGGVEHVQYNALSDLVHAVTLVPLSDRWVWSLESSGEFSVASVRKVGVVFEEFGGVLCGFSSKGDR
uniref:Polygalacturonase At1g48100-like n=1 Tax=Tanacetum cinerariifolium TaxID=118510 RepID=A0A6L2LWZ5_TANCI|nr:polygalacturonase At1g48100-like [Tanacetum cinerariifolium]